MQDPSFNPRKSEVDFMESTFEFDGKVVEVLQGCGTAVVAAACSEVSLNRGTDGIRFEQLYLGQSIRCTVVKRGKRVLFARQLGGGMRQFAFHAGSMVVPQASTQRGH